MDQKNSEKIDLEKLQEICQKKNYYVEQVQLPSIEEVQKAASILEISEEVFLINLLEYQVFTQKLKQISEKTGLTQEAALAHAIALLEKVEELKKDNKEITIVSDKQG